MRPKVYMSMHQLTDFLREHGFSEFGYYTNSDPFGLGFRLQPKQSWDVNDLVPSTLAENGWKLTLISPRADGTIYVEYLANKRLNAQLHWEEGR